MIGTLSAIIQGLMTSSFVTIFPFQPAFFSYIISLNSSNITHLMGHKRTNLARFLDASTAIDWKATNIPSGTFIIKFGKYEITGGIFDALTVKD